MPRLITSIALTPFPRNAGRRQPSSWKTHQTQKIIKETQEEAEEEAEEDGEIAQDEVAHLARRGIGNCNSPEKA
jgi:hypothetical protein